MSRVIFLGEGGFAVPTLEALAESGLLDLVVTRDRKSASRLYFPGCIKESAELLGIPVRTVTAPGELAKIIESTTPQLGIMSNWRWVLDEDVRQLFKQGVVNVHRGLLPWFAGLSPGRWAVASGAPNAGVTFHLATRAVDAGPVLELSAFEVRAGETGTSLAARQDDLIRECVCEVVEGVLSGTAKSRGHDEPLTRWPYRGDAARRIDWTKTAEVVVRGIRADSAPYPSSWTMCAGNRLDIPLAGVYSAKIDHGRCGEVLDVSGDGLLVGCGERSAVRIPGVRGNDPAPAPIKAGTRLI